ncbi:DUF1835 domain-containing protein [Ekhidna sp.]|uniref:DUF1835 domain-containing protein n=1 Tax=Ekhidna sp. TaxID=2608089 RepID=UPI00329A70BC
MKTYHILNGDALKHQFPEGQISGELIVTRECFVEGPVKAKNKEEFFQKRAEFIAEAYGDHNYEQEVIPELSKISQIKDSKVVLWFEEDLFCQINLWFVCSQLYMNEIDVSLVCPENSLQYGFGGFSKDELVAAYQQRKSLSQINVNQFAILWFAYRNDDIERLLKLAVQLHSDFPFVMKAIEAHFDRIPKDGKPGKPEQLIRDIMEEKSTKDFATVFKEFNKRASIYGFGDLQVKRIFDRIN